MRYLRLLITILGLLELSSAAPREVPIPVVEPDCECLAFFQCRNGVINTDGSFIIDPRSVFQSSSICSDDQVCCRKASVTPTETAVRNSQIPVKSGCGHRNPGGIHTRIANAANEQAQFGEFPWMVAVMEKPIAPETETSYMCGGSLIHHRAVLTSAHNVAGKEASNTIVRVGEWDTEATSEPTAHQEREVETIILHENSNTDNLHNDFAILILKTSVQIAPNVNVICLPAETDVFDAVKCTATGWGKDNFGKKGMLQAVLKKVDLPVIPHDPCQSILRLTRLGKAFILDKSFICAGGELGMDTCIGDGGSPLVCPLANDPNRYVQAGIVAWGISCATTTPGVYGNVAKARKWIDSKIAEYEFDTSSYIV